MLHKRWFYEFPSVNICIHVLKSNLIQGKDYIAVDKRAWGLLIELYGCDVEIKRSNFDIYSTNLQQQKDNNNNNSNNKSILEKYQQVVENDSDEEDL